jgi:pyruvate/2-oxoglutarate dehydrogenase complex dihydrolipoamide acyltransferase (E2) component
MAQTIIMPQLGETVAEGKILTWFKAVGDDVKLGDRLFEVETDKVTVEVEATVAGKLTEIKIGNGVTAKVGATVAVVSSSVIPAKAGTQLPTTETEIELDSRLRGNDGNQGTTQELRPFEEVKTPTENFGKAKASDGLRMTPLARRLLAQAGADLSALAQFATSKNMQKIEEKDVQLFLSAKPVAKSIAAPAPVMQSFSSGEVITLNTIRSKTAQRLTENWQNIPHVFQAIDVDFTEIELVRSRHKDRFKAETGSSLTYLPFIARAVCIALQAYPHINARFENNALTLSKDINLGIAVDLNHNGLVVPVVHAVQDFTLQGLAKAIARQIEKARSGKMTSADMSGGTYSITNNGAFGTSFTTPIINAPQVAILSTDAIRKKPAVITTDLGDAIVPRLIGTVGQSFDHRAFDGAYAAAFLSKLKETLETKKWAGELGEPT